MYEVYAVRYGHLGGRRRSDNFLGRVDEPDRPMEMDYYVWMIRNEHRVIAVDAGFDLEEARRRGREALRVPREGLAMLGIDSRQVDDLIITHLHYDHAGTIYDFPAAKVHVQDRELAYA